MTTNNAFKRYVTSLFQVLKVTGFRFLITYNIVSKVPIHVLIFGSPSGGSGHPAIYIDTPSSEVSGPGHIFFTRPSQRLPPAPRLPLDGAPSRANGLVPLGSEVGLVAAPKTGVDAAVAIGHHQHIPRNGHMRANILGYHGCP